MHLTFPTSCLGCACTCCPKVKYTVQDVFTKSCPSRSFMHYLSVLGSDALAVESNPSSCHESTLDITWVIFEINIVYTDTRFSSTKPLATIRHTPGFSTRDSNTLSSFGEIASLHIYCFNKSLGSRIRSRLPVLWYTTCG
jgi:hypothetical protein